MKIYELEDKLERLNGAKCKSISLKVTNQQEQKVRKSGFLPTL